MKKIKLCASVGYANGTTYTMEELGLSEDATEKEIAEVLEDMVMQEIDWGWEEIE